ncbi:CG14607 [Drosophila busckii]|uniref:CG14607 n=1 Tax=Drosophila busckii TaxID=30019 RepID=A0A0M3QX58_DROBS|nr:uncharacterized protein LOC108602152 [Drosophila busckii]ALC45289.1 CG14607 [Drosophila busckii]
MHRKQQERFATILAIFLLLWDTTDAQLQVQAQSGYKYVHPELETGELVGGVIAADRHSPTTYSTGSSIALSPSSNPPPRATAATAYGTGLFSSPPVGFMASEQATTAFGAPAVVDARRSTGTGITARSGPYGPQTQTQTQYGSIAGSAVSPATRQSDFVNVYSDESIADYSAIPGEPGVDYPVYARMPRTNFECAQQTLPGYYADIEAQCQVFHICALNRTYSFLCPNGTVFSQETLVCVWWNQYDCTSAPSLYANNAYIYDYSTGTGALNSAPPNAPNNDVYRSNATPQIVTAYGAVAPSSSTGALRVTNPPAQVPGYHAAHGSYVTVPPTKSQTQSLYGSPSGIALNVATAPSQAINRIHSTAAAGVPALLSGLVLEPSNNYGKQPQHQVLRNREYLPPAGVSHHQKRSIPA